MIQILGVDATQHLWDQPEQLPNPLLSNSVMGLSRPMPLAQCNCPTLTWRLFQKPFVQIHLVHLLPNDGTNGGMDRLLFFWVPFDSHRSLVDPTGTTLFQCDQHERCLQCHTGVQSTSSWKMNFAGWKPLAPQPSRQLFWHTPHRHTTPQHNTTHHNNTTGDPAHGGLGRGRSLAGRSMAQKTRHEQQIVPKSKP